MAWRVREEIKQKKNRIKMYTFESKIDQKVKDGF